MLRRHDTPTPEVAKEILSYTPQRPDYGTWLDIVSAIGNSYSLDVANEILLSHFKDEHKNEHLNKLRGRLKDVNFGTLVYIAKQSDYTPTQSLTNRQQATFVGGSKQIHKPRKKPVKLEGTPLHCYQFQDSNGLDYEAEERAAIIEYEGGLERPEADNTVKRNYDVVSHRVYRVSINSKVLNKNLNPKTGEPHKDFSAFTNEFETAFLSMEELAHAIGRGHSLICCMLQERMNGKCIRNSNSFLGAELFGIDIDNTHPQTKERLTAEEGYLPIQEALRLDTTNEGLLVYTTANHSNEWNRFRILFDLPRFITNPDQYKDIVNHYIGLYGGDAQCKDVARGFYGNNNATIYLSNGKVWNFEAGKLL